MSSTRIYLAQLVQSDDEEIGLYSALDEHVASIIRPTRRVFGGDGVMWMLAHVKSDDHSTMLMDARLSPLPEFDPSTAVASFGPDDVMAILGALSYHGVPATVLTSATTFRDVIHGIGQHLLGQPWDVVSFLAL